MVRDATLVAPTTIEKLVGGTALKRAAICIVGSLALAILSQISVPFVPVPMTMQSLGVMLIGITFGFRLGIATLALYLLEGLVGLPVFANFGSGPAVFIGGTGGYLVGFLCAAAVMGAAADAGFTRSWAGTILVLFAGEAVLFALGVGYLAHLLTLQRALEVGLYPFLLGDALKLLVAACVSRAGLAAARTLIG